MQPFRKYKIVRHLRHFLTAELINSPHWYAGFMGKYLKCLTIQYLRPSHRGNVLVELHVVAVLLNLLAMYCTFHYSHIFTNSALTHWHDKYDYFIIQCNILYVTNTCMSQQSWLLVRTGKVMIHKPSYVFLHNWIYAFIK